MLSVVWYYGQNVRGFLKDLYVCQEKFKDKCQFHWYLADIFQILSFGYVLSVLGKEKIKYYPFSSWTFLLSIFYWEI